jgi:hypothetical protein
VPIRGFFFCREKDEKRRRKRDERGMLKGK